MFLSWICLLFSTLDWGYVFWRKTTEIKYHFHHIRASQVAQKQRIRLPMQETQEVQVWSLGQGGPLDEEMVPHSSVLAWKIPWTEELVGYSPWGCKVSDKTEPLSVRECTHVCTHTHPHIKGSYYQHDWPWLMLTSITWLTLCWGNPYLYSLYLFLIWLKFAYWRLCPSIAALHLEF